MAVVVLKQHVQARHVMLEQRYPHTWPRVRSRITILRPVPPGTLDELLQNMTNEIVSKPFLDKYQPKGQQLAVVADYIAIREGR